MKTDKAAVTEPAHMSKKSSASAPSDNNITPSPRKASVGDIPPDERNAHSDRKRKYKKLCSAEECTNQVRHKGVCIRHGATGATRREPCSIDGCANQARKGGVCIRHGAKVKLCSSEGCTNQFQRRGVCWRHGAKFFNLCKSEGCIRYAQKGGVCNKHGANK
eukprot:scaffold8603_cov155-Skeletonema_menzelii.AAC.13